MVRRDATDDGFTLVELIVSLAILSIIATAVTTLTITTIRGEQTQREVQDVADDARVSFERIRRELRQARRVDTASCATFNPVTETCDEDGSGNWDPSPQLSFWVDEDEDNLIGPGESICYYTAEITPGSGQYQLWRVEDPAAGCDAATLAAAPPAGAQVLAATLVDPAPFTDLEPFPTIAATDTETRNVEITLNLEVLGTRFDRETVFVQRIRLRNVA